MKLTEKEVKDIKSHLEKTLSAGSSASAINLEYRKLALKHKVSQNNIRYIHQGKTWKEKDGEYEGTSEFAVFAAKALSVAQELEVPEEDRQAFIVGYITAIKRECVKVKEIDDSICRNVGAKREKVVLIDLRRVVRNTPVRFVRNGMVIIPLRDLIRSAAEINVKLPTLETLFHALSRIGFEFFDHSNGTRLGISQQNHAAINASVSPVILS